MFSRWTVRGWSVGSHVLEAPDTFRRLNYCQPIFCLALKIGQIGVFQALVIA